MNTARKLSLVSTTRKPVKAKAKLRNKPREKLEIHRLPFVGNDHVHPEAGGVSQWDVPLTGSFHGGTETGAAIALMFLSHLREAAVNGVGIRASLSSIFCSMMERAPNTEEEFLSLKGQAIGFSSALDRWLIAAVTDRGNNLDNINHERLLATANAGLDTVEANKRLDHIFEKSGLVE